MESNSHYSLTIGNEICETASGGLGHATGYDESMSALINEGVNFSQLRIDSREEAFKSLHKVYKDVQIPDGSSGRPASSTSNMILISGASGTGKSTLAEQFFQELQTQAQQHESPIIEPYILRGKHTKKKREDPLSGIISALGSFARGLAQQSASAELETNEDIERLRHHIHQKIGKEAYQLVHVIPDLKHLLGEDAVEPAWNRLQQLLQLFLRAISTAERPVILFLDDLQWMDESSFGLLQSLLLDPSLKNLMLVGAYRTNEVDSSDDFWDVFQAIELFQKYETIALKNLTIREMFLFLADALNSREDSDRGREGFITDQSALLEELTDLVYQNTKKGNLALVNRALHELVRSNTLYFSFITFQWELSAKSEEFRCDDEASDLLVLGKSHRMRVPI